MRRQVPVKEISSDTDMHLEFDARNGDLYWGFHHGLASGDGEQGFGYLDQAELPGRPSSRKTKA